MCELDAELAEPTTTTGVTNRSNGRVENMVLHAVMEDDPTSGYREDVVCSDQNRDSGKWRASVRLMANLAAL